MNISELPHVPVIMYGYSTTHSTVKERIQEITTKVLLDRIDVDPDQPLSQAEAQKLEMAKRDLQQFKSEQESQGFPELFESGKLKPKHIELVERKYQALQKRIEYLDVDPFIRAIRDERIRIVALDASFINRLNSLQAMPLDEKSFVVFVGNKDLLTQLKEGLEHLKQRNHPLYHKAHGWAFFNPKEEGGKFVDSNLADLKQFIEPK